MVAKSCASALQYRVSDAARKQNEVFLPCQSPITLAGSNTPIRDVSGSGKYPKPRVYSGSIIKSWLHFVFLGMVGLAIQDATAGSAVVADGHGNLATAYGGPVDREKQRALNTAHRRYGFNRVGNTGNFLVQEAFPNLRRARLWSHSRCEPSEWSRFARWYRA